MQNIFSFSSRIHLQLEKRNKTKTKQRKVQKHSWFWNE